MDDYSIWQYGVWGCGAPRALLVLLAYLVHNSSQILSQELCALYGEVWGAVPVLGIVNLAVPTQIGFLECLEHYANRITIKLDIHFQRGQQRGKEWFSADARSIAEHKHKRKGVCLNNPSSNGCSWSLEHKKGAQEAPFLCYNVDK